MLQKGEESAWWNKLMTYIQYIPQYCRKENNVYQPPPLPSSSSTSSSIGTTAHCGLWLVEKCPSIISHLPPTKISFYFLCPFFMGLPLLLVPSSSWMKIFLEILSSSILSRWPNQLILCPFIHFTIFSPLLISSIYLFVPLFHSPFSYLGPYILLNIFLSKISTAWSSFSVNVHASAPHDTTGLISVLYNIILISIDHTAVTSTNYTTGHYAAITGNF